MKITSSIIAIAALAAVIPAHAGTIAVDFTGTVFQTQGATGRAVGNTVMGHFDLDNISGNFLDFMIDGKSVAAGFLSSATIGPALTDGIYIAQVSPVSSGMPSNSSFTLDLSSLTNWPSTDTAFTLLTDTAQLANNLDTVNNPLSAFPSTFNYFTASANGSNVVALDANLTSITASVTASAVPEPASLALVASAFVGLGLLVRRRRA